MSDVSKASAAERLLIVSLREVDELREQLDESKERLRDESDALRTNSERCADQRKRIATLEHGERHWRSAYQRMRDEADEAQVKCATACQEAVKAGALSAELSTVKDQLALSEKAHLSAESECEARGEQLARVAHESAAAIEAVGKHLQESRVAHDDDKSRLAWANKRIEQLTAELQAGRQMLTLANDKIDDHTETIAQTGKLIEWFQASFADAARHAHSGGEPAKQNANQTAASALKELSQRVSDKKWRS